MAAGHNARGAVLFDEFIKTPDKTRLQRLLLQLKIEVGHTAIEMNELRRAAGPGEIRAVTMDEITFVHQRWAENMARQLQRHRMLKHIAEPAMPIRQSAQTPILVIGIG